MQNGITAGRREARRPRSRWRGVVMLAAVAAWSSASLPLARADFPEPRLTAVYPAGGRRGTEFDVALVGTDLDEVHRLEFFHPGIRSTPIVPAAGEFDPEPPPVSGKVRVAIASDVPPGVYDAVAIGRFGASNPRAFMVGTAPEGVKTVPIDTREKAMQVPADGVVHGRPQAGAADHFAVELAAGTRLRAEVWARRLDSRLDANLELLDPTGSVVARSQRPRDEDAVLEATASVSGRHVVRLHDRFARGGDDCFYRLALSTGPTVETVFPPVVESGTGSVRLTALGRGLPDATPSAVSDDVPGLVERPVDVRPGTFAAARHARRLLAARDASVNLVDLHGDLLDRAPLPPAAVVVNGPPTVEREPNDTAAQAMAIQLPAVLAGQANPRGDRDWFSFEAKEGESWVFDLHSRRLGMPTDMSIVLERVVPAAEGQPAPAPQQVAASDDGPADVPTSYGPASLDPVLAFTAAADGTYRVLVRELAVDSVAGVDRSWVMEVRRPDPGFDLVALLFRHDRGDANRAVRGVPVVAIGGSTPVEVLVVRRDGFAEDIVLEAEGLPTGVTAAPSIVPGGSGLGTLVLTAAEGTPPQVSTFRIVGRAPRSGGEGGEIVRIARPVTLRWDAVNQNQPRAMREARSLPLAVTTDTAPITVEPGERKTWQATRGGKVTVPLSVIWREGSKGSLSLTAVGLPADLKVPTVTIDERATHAEVTIEIGQNLTVGTHVVVLRGVAKKSFMRNPQLVERLRADAARIAEIAKRRAAEIDAARQTVADAERRRAVAQAPDKAIEEAVAAARKALAEAEARSRGAEAERVRREKIASDAAAAAAAKDIDVPVVVPPIVVVVAEPPKQEAKQP